jgi:hypothetical protein
VVVVNDKRSGRPRVGFGFPEYLIARLSKARQAPQRQEEAHLESGRKGKTFKTSLCVETASDQLR